MIENNAAGTSFDWQNTPEYPKVLFPGEKHWKALQPWLEQNGYLLRPRYMPDWKPSWTDLISEVFAEDACISVQSSIIDATRSADGKLVALKRVVASVHPYEVEISRYFSNEPMKSHPRNHCIPLLDVLEVPDHVDPEHTLILVVPFLRPFQDPRMKSIGEAVEFIRQIFEGMQFMHSCHIAHRDAMDLNIMMDPNPTYPNMFHPVAMSKNRNFKGKAKHFTRTARPTKYYFIDFGLSRQYNPDDGPPLEYPIFGGDKSVPEFNDRPHDPCDPFPTDIYYLGNMIKETFLDETRGLEFMSSLVSDMTQWDPSKRPGIDEVVGRFDALLRRLYWWTLRSRLVYNDESPFRFVKRYITHWIRTTGHVLLFRPALPTPKHD